MWSAEHSLETSAAPERIWRLWADVARWPEWNGDIERIELEGTVRARRPDRDDTDRAGVGRAQDR